MPRALWWSWGGGGGVIMNEVPLQRHTADPKRWCTGNNHSLHHWKKVWFIGSQTRLLHANEEDETRRQGSNSPVTAP